MKHIQNTIFLLTSLFIMVSCGEDRSGEYYALIGENLWIEQTMKEHYLWYDNMPEIKESDYFSEPENFLQKLIYTKAQDGKGDPYSHIETIKYSDDARSFLQRNATYGFDFELMTDPTGTSSHTFARVLFVLPHSPASEAGLERGDWISAIGKEKLTSNKYSQLMEGGHTTFARESLVFDEEDTP
ncbi:MAG: peptidase S41, partial [Phocaeicola sp.]|nr:peptidase S41 [Phocaeicola sp.]